MKTKTKKRKEKIPTESVRLRKELVEKVRKRKQVTNVPINRFIETAIQKELKRK